MVRAEALGAATLSFDYLPAAPMPGGPPLAPPQPAAAAPGGAANRVSVVVTVHGPEEL